MSDQGLFTYGECVVKKGRFQGLSPEDTVFMGGGGVDSEEVSQNRPFSQKVGESQEIVISWAASEKCTKKDEEMERVTLSRNSKTRIEFESLVLLAWGLASHWQRQLHCSVGTESSLKWGQNRIESEEEVTVKTDKKFHSWGHWRLPSSIGINKNVMRRNDGEKEGKQVANSSMNEEQWLEWGP